MVPIWTDRGSSNEHTDLQTTGLWELILFEGKSGAGAFNSSPQDSLTMNLVLRAPIRGIRGKCGIFAIRLLVYRVKKRLELIGA